MAYDLVEELNKPFKEEELDFELDFPDCTVIFDQIDNSLQFNGITTNNTYTGQETSIKNQNMDYENSDIDFFPDASILDDVINNTENYFDTENPLNTNEECINFDDISKDATMELIENEYIYQNSQSTICSQTYPFITKHNNPMLSSNSIVLNNNKLVFNFDDSNQIISSQESYDNIWSNTMDKVTEMDNEKHQINYVSKIKTSTFLRLDTNMHATQTDISTPIILADALSLEKDFALRNSPTPKIEIKEETYDGDVTESTISHRLSEISPPSVQSNYSDDVSLSSNYSTAPPTPSTSKCTLRSQPKRRGRPPKMHSDQLNLAELSYLSEAERKHKEQRHKNNEASRQSRLNRRQKDEESKKGLEKLQYDYNILQRRFEQLTKQNGQLKSVLARIISRSGD